MQVEEYTIEYLLNSSKIDVLDIIKNKISETEFTYYFKWFLRRSDIKEILRETYKFILKNNPKIILAFMFLRIDIFENIVKENFRETLDVILKYDIKCISIFDKRFMDELYLNIDYLMKQDNYANIFIQLCKSKLGVNYLKKAFPAFLERVKEDIKNSVNYEKNTEAFSIFLQMANRDDLKKLEPTVTFICQCLIDKFNMLYFLKNYNVINYFCIGASKNEKLNDIINAKINDIYDLFIYLSLGGKTKYCDYLRNLILDVQRIERAEAKDIRLSEGGYSNAIIIGNKVIKVGIKFGNTHKIVYDKRLLQPVMRDGIIDKYDDSTTLLFEVYEKVDTKNISDSDVYFVFKDMLSRGKLWTDSKKDNLGRLLKSNTVHLNDEAVSRSKDGVYNKPYYVHNNIDSNYIDMKDIKGEILKKGELVVIDLEYVYDIREYMDDIHNEIKTYSDFDVSDFEDLLKINLHGELLHCQKYLSMYIEEKKREFRNKKV